MSLFPITPWTVLMKATLDGDAEGQASLERLCRTYRDPVVRFLGLRGYSHADAEDAAQELFVKLLRNRVWKRADRTRGKFRNYLLTILKNSLASEARRARSQKNGGEFRHVSWEDIESGSDGAAYLPETCHEFDLHWARSTLRAAVGRVEERWRERGKEREYTIYRRFLPGSGTEKITHAEAAAALGTAETATRAAVSRLRDELAGALREEIQATVASPEEVEDELNYLMEVLRQPGSSL